MYNSEIRFFRKMILLLFNFNPEIRKISNRGSQVMPLCFSMAK
ncbi:hypothetical protein LEP1GSC168_0702 [Leptospira santarosai str. HAI134]|uniref:Uncharacterized protein n=1 Tax=Leptospira santarosai str. MOR084 TaxID=1049984 RepID=A0A0E2BAJ7_9LEPT|nr:hypothetical protein LEP1GSC179_4016 [Leptospira santarosai str. MOR084]EMJ47273.1 hypothetical protein LEP1GSC169_1807 [Leptospira santarosai str. HAI1349]EMO23019.1 hypothetical protein LEP1GSC168_0702 [Leptospira santarosai str. HAI134]